MKGQTKHRNFRVYSLLLSQRWILSSQTVQPCNCPDSGTTGSCIVNPFFCRRAFRVCELGARRARRLNSRPVTEPFNIQIIIVFCLHSRAFNRYCLVCHSLEGKGKQQASTGENDRAHFQRSQIMTVVSLIGFHKAQVCPQSFILYPYHHPSPRILLCSLARSARKAGTSSSALPPTNSWL